MSDPAYETSAGGRPRGATAGTSPAASRRLRVLFINDTARNGGPGRSLFYILKFLDPAVIERSVCLPRPGVISRLYETEGVTDRLFFEPLLVENPIEPLSRAMTREDFDAPLSLRGARLLANVGKGTLAMARLADRIRQERYDLLYCNGTTADFAGAGLAKMTGVPALWHVRYTSVPRALRPLHDSLAKSREVARIVCVSKASAKLFPACREKVRVIQNALDTSEFVPGPRSNILREELGLGDDVVLFGSHGRVLPRKGYVEMVRAAKIALEEATDDERRRMAFVVVGDTPQDMRPDHVVECRDLVKSLQMDDRFFFVGFRDDIKPCVSDFDVAVVPSVYQDPLPRAVIESMALAKPVVAFDVGGVGEMLADGETGIMLRGSPPDVKGMGQAFLRYLRDADRRRDDGERGRRRVEEHFDGQVQAQRIQEQIAEAVVAYEGGGA